MKLPKEIRDRISSVALSYLERQRSSDFSCIDFVREVYQEVGIPVPKMLKYTPPPEDFNITKEDLDAWEYGYIIFLIKRTYVGERTWTHVAITLPEGKLIDCSDGHISIDSKEEIFASHHYVPTG